MDGCRALWDGAELRTRNGQRLDAPAELHGITERIDGEYLRGVFYAFDLPDHPGTLDERWAALQALGIQTIPAWVSRRDVTRTAGRASYSKAATRSIRAPGRKRRRLGSSSAPSRTDRATAPLDALGRSVSRRS